MPRKPAHPGKRVRRPPRQVWTVEYAAKHYESFRRLMLDRLAVTVPDWKERNAADLGIALVEFLAYVGDQLSTDQDAVAKEAYLGTARRRVSTRRYARRDLLASDKFARTYVVRVEEDGTTYVRFGDGKPGERLPPGEGVYASYRIGNGTRGNAGRGAISRIVCSPSFSAAGVKEIRNPVEAKGRIDPKGIEEVGQRTPQAFRTQEMAVHGDDHEDDFAIALVEFWAIVGDILTFYQERIAKEGFLGTATKRVSLLQVARAIGYELKLGAAARAFLALNPDDSSGSVQQTSTTSEPRSRARISKARPLRRRRKSSKRTRPKRLGL